MRCHSYELADGTLVGEPAGLDGGVDNRRFFRTIQCGT
jgi:hypothetical protein